MKTTFHRPSTAQKWASTAHVTAYSTGLPPAPTGVCSTPPL